MANRATTIIDDGMKQGHNLFLLDGRYIDDWVLHDLYNGVLSVKESYKRFFLTENNFDYYVWIKNTGIETFKLTDSGVVMTNELTSGSVDEDSQFAGFVRPSNDSDEADSNAAQATAEASDADQAALQNLVAYCQDHPDKRVAVFFENLDWTAGMYKSTNDDRLFVVENILKLCKCNNCVVTATIKDVRMLEKYKFDTGGKNVEMMGSPSVDEIWRTYLRMYTRKYKRVHEITLEDFRSLRSIAEAIGSGEHTLKEAIRVFDRVMSENDGRLNIDDFESAVDKLIQEKVTLEQVVLKQSTKDEVVQAVDNFIDAEDVSKVTRGIALTGPPGTGKTYLVKALANEKNCYFMSPSLADLKGEYVGHTSANVKRVFQQARANAPTIMFIDEADTIFKTRGAGAGDSDSFTKDMVNQFLVEMDGLTAGQSKVFIIAATNRINDIDPAILSRLGKPVDVPLPGRDQRRQIFTLQFKERGVEHFTELETFENLLNKTNRMSGRDIKNYVGMLEKTAKIDLRKLEDYKTEEEVSRLFRRTLNMHRDDLIRTLVANLNVEIRLPQELQQGFDSVIGNEAVKDAVTRQVDMFDRERRRRAEGYHIKPRRGILMYGPPGNGKSQLAAASAREKNLVYMKVTSDALVRDTLSEASHILADIFNGAIQLSELCTEQDGVLLFFDEFDALSAAGMDPRIRGTLLTLLDDQNTMRNNNTRVLFVGATNNFASLDQASIRSGRIDEKIYMDNPSHDEGIQMIQQFAVRNDRTVEVPWDLAKQAYETYAAGHADQEIAKWEEIALRSGSARSPLLGRERESIRHQLRPSAADLENYVNRLLEYAFLQLPASSDEKLRITPEIIDAVCTSMLRVEVERGA